MSIRFAAPPSANPVAMCLDRRCEWSLLAVNDNQAEGEGHSEVHSALRHFASHGLVAAREAGKQAEQAALEGDDEAYRWWFGICRTLDRRLARELRARREQAESDLAGGLHP